MFKVCCTCAATQTNDEDELWGSVLLLDAALEDPVPLALPSVEGNVHSEGWKSSRTGVGSTRAICGGIGGTGSGVGSTRAIGRGELIVGGGGGVVICTVRRVHSCLNKKWTNVS
jgi:hypothetical protein